MALGAIEPQFYQVFLEKSGLEQLDGLPNQMDQEEWGKLRKMIEEKFLEKTQHEWTEIFDMTDACVSPVMTAEEAAENKHNKERFLIKNASVLFIYSLGTHFFSMSTASSSPILSHDPALLPASSQQSSQMSANTQWKSSPSSFQNGKCANSSKTASFHKLLFF